MALTGGASLRFGRGGVVSVAGRGVDFGADFGADLGADFAADLGTPFGAELGTAFGAARDADRPAGRTLSELRVAGLAAITSP